MKKGISCGIEIVIAAVLFFGGFLLLKLFPEPAGVVRALPFVCIGIGCGLLGHGIGKMAAEQTRKKYPEVARQADIEENDERNVVIRDRAKAKAYDRMVYIFGALMLVFALLGVELVAVLLLVFAYLLVVGVHVYYIYKMNKEI